MCISTTCQGKNIRGEVEVDVIVKVSLETLALYAIL